MSFANPIFFWAFLSLIPLIAIYLLKVRPNRKPTTAYFLWEDIFQEKRAQSLLHRLRDVFSLMLMLLAFAAIVLALAKPAWTGDEQRDLVLLIDHSASMNAQDGMGTRLENAKRIATNIVESLNGTQRCSVAEVADKVHFVSNMTDNPRELQTAIESIQQTQLPFNPLVLDQFELQTIKQKTTSDSNHATEEVLNPQESQAYRVIMIGDGLVGREVPNSVELLKVGTASTENVGIIACDLERVPGSNRIAVFYQLTSTYSRPIETELVLSYDNSDNIVKLIPVTIEPGVNPAEVFELENADAGRWRLQMEIEDALPDDDSAFLILPPIKPITVSVATEEKFFYENSVVAFSESGGLLELVQDSGQMQICQGNPLTHDSDASHRLIFRPEGNSPWWQNLGQEIEVAAARVVDDEHPVIRHVDATTIPFVGSRRLEAPPGSEVWVEAEDGTPLIYKLTRSGMSSVIVNLDPLNSNFYFSAWFPVLVYSSARHLAGRSETLKSTYATGSVAPVPGAQDGRPSMISPPVGEPIDISSASTPPLASTGYYELKASDESWQVACSLISAVESQIDNTSVADTSKPINRGTSPVGLFTVLAIVVAMLESILFQRRKVG